VGALDGRVALVTGASRGIGAATARRLAAEGADVAVTARSLTAVGEGWSLQRTADAVTAAGRRALAIEWDLADPAVDRGALVERVEDELGPVDVLVNNAADGGYRRFADWDDATLGAVQETNVWAPWQLMRRVLPGMLERGAGWIVNVSSVVAELPSGPPFGAGAPARKGTIYGGTKAMLNRVTVSVAAEHHGTGVAVNAVSPLAATATEGVLAAIAAGQIPEHLTEPLDSMVEAILALATADPAELTGQIAYSLPLLRDLGRPVHDISGVALVDGWQPDDLPARISAMEAPWR
jgi:NAD(P)-dependent dehydrogenase (short-subunit alcohol dehydrogenase family)